MSNALMIGLGRMRHALAFVLNIAMYDIDEARVGRSLFKEDLAFGLRYPSYTY